MKKTSLIGIIRSNTFALWIAILSVIVQSFHSYTAFYNTSSLNNVWGIAQAVLFSIVIDLAILFYTVRGRKDIARLAALVMVIINCYYYFQNLGLTFEFIFGVFLSLIIPVSVYFYSEEIPKGEESAEDLISKIKEQDASLNNAKINFDKMIDENNRLREMNQDLGRRLEDVADVSLLNIERDKPEEDQAQEEDDNKGPITKSDRPYRG